MQLKKGKKLLCKKDRTYPLDETIESYVSAGKYYKVIDILKLNAGYDIHIDVNMCEPVKFYLGEYDEDYYNLYEYFYSEQELRCKKLEKLNK